jgi:hypothetical protein
MGQVNDETCECSMLAVENSDPDIEVEPTPTIAAANTGYVISESGRSDDLFPGPNYYRYAQGSKIKLDMKTSKSGTYWPSVKVLGIIHYPEMPARLNDWLNSWRQPRLSSLCSTSCYRSGESFRRRQRLRSGSGGRRVSPTSPASPRRPRLRNRRACAVPTR